MKVLIFLFSLFMCCSGCITYEHMLDASQYSAPIKMFHQTHHFLRTETYDMTASKRIEDQLETELTPEERNKLVKSNWMRRPTYMDLTQYVKRKYGQKATFANVVWDVRRVSFLAIESERIIGVTFDVYLPNE